MSDEEQLEILGHKEQPLESRDLLDLVEELRQRVDLLDHKITQLLDMLEAGE